MIDHNNAWRADTPGSAAWPRSPRPDAANKYFICSADCHVQEPNDFLSARIDARYHDRLPGIVLGGDGSKLQKTEGFRPMKIGSFTLEGEDRVRSESGKTPQERAALLQADQRIAGVDLKMTRERRRVDRGKCDGVHSPRPAGIGGKRARTKHVEARNGEAFGAREREARSK